MSPFQDFHRAVSFVRFLCPSQTKHLEFEVSGRNPLRFRRRTVAFVQNQQARRRGDHSRLFHRFLARRRQSLRAVPEPGAGRLHVEFSLRHECRARNSVARGRSEISSCVLRCAIPSSSRRALASRRSAPCFIGCWPILPGIRISTSGSFSVIAPQATSTTTTSSFDSPINIRTFIICRRSAGAAPIGKGLRGYVQEHVPEIAEGRSDMHAYICGLEKMVKANRELLKGLAGTGNPSFTRSTTEMSTRACGSYLDGLVVFYC